MRLISSRTTFFSKRVFPVIWFGFLAAFVALSFLIGFSFIVVANVDAGPPLVFYLAPVLMAVFGYVVMKKLVFNLVDEVWDDGDTLVVKNRGQEERIALSDIKNVSYSAFINPPRVTLSLRQPTAFGEEINFAAPMRLVPFSRSPVILELIDRVDLARQKNVSRIS
jgi:hypothetical protein